MTSTIIFALMKLILALEIISVILKNVLSSSCNIPHGLHVYELGIVYTLTCIDLRIGIHFDKRNRTFSKFQSFYRARCDENGDIVLFTPQENSVIFCTDNSCLVPDSVKLLKNLTQHFNGSVISTINLSEIYYCIDSKWYSLFNSVLPKELVNVTEIGIRKEQRSSFKPWVEVNPEDTKFRRTKISKFHSIGIEDNHNFSVVKNLKVLHANYKNIDLCGITIIVTVISSFFFIVTIILILSSRFIQKHHIRHSFIQPNSTFIDSKTFIDQERVQNNENTSKSDNVNVNNNAFNNNNITNNKEISCIFPVTQFGKTDHTLPSKMSKNVELGTL